MVVFHDSPLSSSPHSLLSNDHDRFTLCLTALGEHILLRSRAIWKRGSISAFTKQQSANRALLAVRQVLDVYVSQRLMGESLLADSGKAMW